MSELSLSIELGIKYLISSSNANIFEIIFTRTDIFLFKLNISVPLRIYLLVYCLIKLYFQIEQSFCRIKRELKDQFLVRKERLEPKYTSLEELLSLLLLNTLPRPIVRIRLHIYFNKWTLKRSAVQN